MPIQGLSACIEWLFAAEHPDFCERIRASREAGLQGVEFHLWRNKPLDDIRRTLDETGLSLNAIVVEPRCRLPDPAAHVAFVQAFRDTLATAQRLGARSVIPSVGLAIPGIALEVQRAAIVSILKQAAAMAADTGVALLLEPVNSRVDHPGMYLDSTAEGLAIVEAVAAPNLRLLYDVYHSATMGEAPETLLQDRTQLLGYVQVADSPGRGEPGSGRIDWPRYLRLLESLGYRGSIGPEYKPTNATLASLQRTRECLGA